MAAKLTGWKIDVRSQSNPDAVQEGGVASAGSDPDADFGDATETTGQEKLDLGEKSVE